MKQDEALQILKTGASAFLTGEPGSGKSYVASRFVSHLRRENLPVAVTASPASLAATRRADGARLERDRRAVADHTLGHGRDREKPSRNRQIKKRASSSSMRFRCCQGRPCPRSARFASCPQIQSSRGRPAGRFRRRLFPASTGGSPRRVRGRRNGKPGRR